MDGDGAAAMRYTEARLQKLTMHLLDGIDKDTVDFYPNFDETMQQPAVLPARFPNLLVNGSNGIAVGMATNIPPHNLTEVINGVICMIDNPECTVEDLMQHIKGPDFPTGGLILAAAASGKPIPPAMAGLPYGQRPMWKKWAPPGAGLW